MFCRITAMNEKAGDNVLTNYESINVYNEQVHKCFPELFGNGGEELQGAITGYHLY